MCVCKTDDIDINFGYVAAIFDIDLPRRRSWSLKVPIDVLCIVVNTYIVFKTTCLSVTAAKLLLLPVS